MSTAHTPVVVYDASTLTTVVHGSHMSVTTPDGHVLVTTPSVSVTPESVYRALKQARNTTTIFATPTGDFVETQVAMYIPRVGMVTTHDRVYRTGTTRIPRTGLHGHITPAGDLCVAGETHPQVEVRREDVTTALRVYDI